MNTDGVGDWLTRGASAVRADARRALDELVARGDLPAEEAQRLEEAIRAALDRSAEFLSANVVAPLGELFDAATGSIRSAVGHDDDVAALQAKLDVLGERLARIEARLEGRAEPGDQP